MLERGDLLGEDWQVSAEAQFKEEATYLAICLGAKSAKPPASANCADTTVVFCLTALLSLQSPMF